VTGYRRCAFLAPRFHALPDGTTTRADIKTRRCLVQKAASITGKSWKLGCGNWAVRGLYQAWEPLCLASAYTAFTRCEMPAAKVTAFYPRAVIEDLVE